MEDRISKIPESSNFGYPRDCAQCNGEDNIQHVMIQNLFRDRRKGLSVREVFTAYVTGRKMSKQLRQASML